MCKYHTKFNELLAELNGERTKLVAELSKLDKYVSSLYHELEKVELAEEFAFSFTSHLHDVLKKRRVVKDELARLDAVLHPVMAVENEVKELVVRRKNVSKRWKREFKMQLSIEEIITQEQA